MVRVLSKCTVCNALGLDCRENRCSIEYAKYLIIISIINQIEERCVRVFVPSIDGLSDAEFEVAQRELNRLRKRRELIKAFMKYLGIYGKYLNNTDESSTQ